MIKKLTVNGITETISNAELHVEEKNEKELKIDKISTVIGSNKIVDSPEGAKASILSFVVAFIRTC